MSEGLLLDLSQRSSQAMSDYLTFRLLTYIRAVAESQNFTRAAQGLYLATAFIEPADSGS
jgi:hypothetical protein